MTVLQEIEERIPLLTESEFTKLREIVADYHHAQWDEQIAQDFDAGKLDHLLARAKTFRSGD